MKTTNISQFKTHIGQVLRSVREGEQIVIMDRDIPVARVIPYADSESQLIARRPTRALEFRKLGFTVSGDPVEYLREDRARR